MDSEDRHACCVSPQKEFTFPRTGDEPLASDTKATVSLPAGIISPEGMTSIMYYLRSQTVDYQSKLYDLSYRVPELGTEWQGKRGNFAKRLSTLAYKEFGIKLTPEIMAGVGTIAREHSKPVSVRVEFTRRLNRSASYFYHSDSCWWEGYRTSRCALKTNGGLGMRTFDEWGDVSGRAWVLPLKRGMSGLRPTFDTVSPAAMVVFNEYGDLAEYAAPRILSCMTGWTYRRVSFECTPMYVNSGGYLIAPEAVTREYERKSLLLSVHQHSKLFEQEQEAARTLFPELINDNEKEGNEDVA